MDFYDYACTNTVQITRKKHEEIKILLRDNISFPILGKDDQGYAIYLAKPKILRNNLVGLHGMVFDSKNARHRKILWHLFKASVYHLSLHAGISDFEIYADWAKDKNMNLATYVVSSLEDAVTNAYLRARWSPLIPDIAYANAISYLRLKPSSSVPNSTLQIMASTLSSFTTGMIKGTLPKEMHKDVNYLVTCLREIEDLTYKELSSGKTKEINSKSINHRKVKLVDGVYKRLSRYGEPAEIPSLPYTEDHGMNSVFYENLIPAEDEIQETLEHALVRLGSKLEQDDFSERLFENEVSQVFSTWKSRRRTQEKILKNYEILGSNTHFSSFEFPQQDYTDYLRRKTYLAGPIRRILNRLRLLKNLYGDDYRHETGLLDLQEAIQVVASKSPRTDVFSLEELQSMVEAWAILVDASRSLNYFHGEVRGIVLCLAEVANELFLDKSSWGVFAFSNKFYVVKDFSEVYTNRIRARIGGLKHSGLTYLPDGIMLAAEALKKRLEEAKVLIVVSDFFPSGYENIEEELAENVKKIEKSGIGTIGIGVNNEAVKNYFRINCVVETPYELMKKFAKAFIEYSAMM